MAEPQLEKQDGLTRIERVSFAERAYEAIRASIVSGRFHAGEQLVEARLATELDVSRGPVREALRRMTEEGLVVANHHRGATVRVFTVDDIVDLYNVRVGLESVAIRLATRSRGSTEPLRRAIEGMREAAAMGDTTLLSNRELAFHEELCELSGNAYVVSLFKSIAAQVRIAFTFDNAEYANPLEVAREHEPLVDAIERGDEDEAARLLHRHVVGTLPPVLRRLGGEEALGRLLVDVVEEDKD